MKNSILLLLLSIFFSSLSFAQQNIGGIINEYQEVIQFNKNTQSVTVGNSSSFSTGDLVLVIQMKGAQIDETQSDNFGTIKNYNGAGNYEFHRICRISVNELFFHNQFIKSYENKGNIQVIKVPEYFSGVKLNATLSGNAWDGKSGGVLVLRVTGSLNLDTFNINMNGKGFKGGQALPSGGGCVFLSSTTRYTNKNSANDRALKGEGIAEYISGKECSRGPQANGGGGGNNHNAGGGGGSNYGVGGSGGQRIKSSTFSCGSVVGLDSKSLANGYSQSKVFLGGGGGAGHGNNAGSLGESGENGGGIIFIIGDTIIGNGQKIMANGNSATANSENEGGGGGGAGGTIIFNVKEFHTQVFAEAKGGTGVSVDNFPSTNCSGAGGGGSGGYIASALSSSNSNLIMDLSGGKSGLVAKSTQSGCPVGSKNGAKDGTIGGSSLSYSILDQSEIIPPTTSSRTACNKYQSPSGKFLWTTSGIKMDTVLNQAGCDSTLEINLTVLTVDTSIGQEGLVLFSNANGTTYQWMDCTSGKIISGETNKQFSPKINGSFAVIVGTGGCFDTSGCKTTVGVGIDSYTNSKNAFTQIRVFPNPSSGKFNVTFPYDLEQISGKVYTISGSFIQEINIQNTNKFEIQIFQSGIFILELEIDGNAERFRLVKN